MRNRSLYTFILLPLLLLSGVLGQDFETKLIADDVVANDLFGCSVSIDNNRILIGAYMDDDKGRDSGSAYIFNWNGIAWVEEAKLTASDGDRLDYFGNAVSIDSTRAIIGARFDDDNGVESGSAYIFKWNGAAWVEEGKILASDGYTGDNFGNAVSINNGQAIIGAYWDDDHSTKSGSVYFYEIQIPFVDYTATSLAFNSVPVNEQLLRTFSVKNVGVVDLIVSDMAFTVNNYSASLDTFTVSSGQSQEITVTFAPDSAMIYDGNIIITHNGTTSPDSIILTGRGIAPALSISQDSLLFGEVQIGEQTELVISIQNAGDAVLNIDSIYTSIPNFEAVDTVLMVNPGSVGSITVLFAPSEIRPYLENLVLRSNVLGNPDTLMLLGIGIEPYPELLLSSMYRFFY